RHDLQIPFHVIEDALKICTTEAQKLRLTSNLVTNIASVRRAVTENIEVDRRRTRRRVSIDMDLSDMSVSGRYRTGLSAWIPIVHGTKGMLFDGLEVTDSESKHVRIVDEERSQV